MVSFWEPPAASRDGQNVDTACKHKDKCIEFAVNELPRTFTEQ